MSIFSQCFRCVLSILITITATKLTASLGRRNEYILSAGGEGEVEREEIACRYHDYLTKTNRQLGLPSGI